jgi:phosphate transport system protein
MLEQEIVILKKELINYAIQVQSMIDKSVRGLTDRDKKLLVSVKDVDEITANETEIKMEEDCTVLIAKYQPAAKYLRTIMMTAQMINDLERMADLAVNIVESSLVLLESPPLKPLIDIPHMARITMSMVKDSIDSFINEDSELARDVCVRDDEIDDLQDQILRELITYMMSNPRNIERSFQLMRIANSLERIADHSTNLCEDVIYINEG